MMSSAVLDSSAVLAVLFREKGADSVGKLIDTGSVCAVNHTEVLSKAVERGSSLEDAIRQLARFNFVIVPFDSERAGIAAALRPVTKPLGLSLADRACLSLGIQTSLPIVTADRNWSKLDLGISIELFR